MKRCPQCGREYDTSMMFCLDDGAELLYGPATSESGAVRGSREGIPSGLQDATGELSNEPATAILSDPRAPATGFTSGESPTHTQRNTGEKTVVLPSGSVDFAQGNGFDKRLLLAPIVLAFIVLGGFAGYRYFQSSGPKRITSIAVLPFENTSGIADSEYLSDGVAESLIYRLSQIPDLKVSPRSSVFRYKGRQIDAEQVGSELGVDAVMSGRMVQRGDSLSISVDLVDVRDRKTLWGEQFERKMSDLLATQREIAATIAQKLQVQLTGDAATGLTKNYTDSNEAYREYLQGRFYWNRRSPDTISKAVEHLELAVEKDPNFALAYAGLADAQMITQYLSRKWSDDYLIAKAQENAERAIQLDPTLAEPHATLGLIKSFHWKWDESESEYKRAIEINPKYATTYHWYSRLLRTEGRYPEALAQIKKGQEADPLSVPIAENVVQNLVENGDLDGALAQCKRTLELDPNFWSIHFRQAAVHFEKGEKAEGFAAASRSIELIGRAPIALGFWGYALAVAGKRDEALAVAKELEQKYAAKEMDGVRIASVYIGLGDKDKVFEWLEKDFQARRPTLMEMRLEMEFRSVRDDPRYKDLLKRMNLPE